MEKEEFVQALTALTQHENFLEINREVNDLRKDFEDYLLEATRQYQIAELKAEDEGIEFTMGNWMLPLKERFYAIYVPFKEKYKALSDEKKQEETQNLNKKRNLIQALKEVIEKEEHIGAAFAAQKEINEKWKAIGAVPRRDLHGIQHEYSRLLEDFFYNINIYKEIKDYDFQKNFTAKQEIITKLKKLVEEQEITKIQEGIKHLQDAWDNIGPTKQELWDKIKDEYWSSVNKVYERIQQFYEEKREERKANFEHKKELITQAEALLNKERTSVKQWNSDTDSLLTIQKEWKVAGFGPSRKEDNEIWKTFRSLCDTFFEEKHTFFESVHEVFDQVAVVKNNLIAQVEQLKISTEWSATTKEVIRLQREWKKAGSAGQKNESKLWKQFRGACDYFFDAKEAAFKEKEKEFQQNLADKQALIVEIEQYKLPENQDSAIESLTQFSDRFSAIGFVPKAEKDAIYTAYKVALNTHYDNLNLKGGQKENILFRAKLNTLKGSGNAKVEFENERQHLRNKIKVIQQEVTQLENNLGFFKHADDKNPLKQQVLNDINQQKEKLDAIKTKLKMIPHE